MPNLAYLRTLWSETLGLYYDLVSVQMIASLGSGRLVHVETNFLLNLKAKSYDGTCKWNFLSRTLKVVLHCTLILKILLVTNNCFFMNCRDQYWWAVNREVLILSKLPKKRLMPLLSMEWTLSMVCIKWKLHLCDSHLTFWSLKIIVMYK